MIPRIINNSSKIGMREFLASCGRGSKCTTIVTRKHNHNEHMIYILHLLYFRLSVTFIPMG
jgi:hypothetical protein